METVWHLALADDWADARARGVYAVSTRGATLADVGFVHASAREQVDDVAAFVFADETAPLVLLEISVALLATHGVPVRWEPGDPADPASERYPHLYGAVPLVAVLSARRALMLDGALVVEP